MSEHLDRAKQYHAAIRSILLRQWDPIGVADVKEAQDEYDSYIGQIYGLLIRNEPKHKLFDFLWWAETDHMGLSGNRKHTEEITDQLMKLHSQLNSGT